MIDNSKDGQGTEKDAQDRFHNFMKTLFGIEADEADDCMSMFLSNSWEKEPLLRKQRTIKRRKEELNKDFKPNDE